MSTPSTSSKYVTKHGESTKTLLAPNHVLSELFKADDAAHNQAVVFKMMEAAMTQKADDETKGLLALWPSDYPKDMWWLPCRCLCFNAPEPMQWVNHNASNMTALRFFVHTINANGQDAVEGIVFFDWKGKDKKKFYEDVTKALLLADCEGPATVAAAGHMEEAKAQFLLSILRFAWLGSGAYSSDRNVMPGGFWSGPEKLRRAILENYCAATGSIAEKILFRSDYQLNAAGVAVHRETGAINYLREIFKYSLLYLAQHEKVRAKQQAQFRALHAEFFANDMPRENFAQK